MEKKGLGCHLVYIIQFFTLFFLSSDLRLKLSFGECFKLNLMFARSGELVNYISSMPSSAEIVRAMDEISNTVISSLSALLHPC